MRGALSLGREYNASEALALSALSLRLLAPIENEEDLICG